MGKFNLGAGLLNEASQAMKISKEFNVIPVELDLIDPSEDNEGMSLDDIDELAQSILDNGLDQNLVVIPTEDNRYKLLSGHRRRLALLQLVEQGHAEYRQVPCLIKELSSITLNISQNGKEKFALLTTNIQRRNNTVSDNLKLMQLADEVFNEMKAAGEPVGKRREWIAQTLGISNSTVRDLTAIDQKATDKVKQAIEENKVPLTVASEIVKMPEEEQDTFIEEKQESESLSVSDVTEFKTQQTVKKQQENLPYQTYIFTMKEFKELSSSLTGFAPTILEDEGALVLKATEYEKVLAAKKAIEKNLDKVKAVIETATKRYQKNK